MKFAIVGRYIRRKLNIYISSISVYDASVKIPVGVKYGNIWQFGNFDECMAITTDPILDEVTIKPKYCLTDIEYELSGIQSSIPKRSQVSFHNFTLTDRIFLKKENKLIIIIKQI